jgi:hypothetical protein
MGLDQAERLVVTVLNFIASDSSRLAHFLSITGFPLETLQEVEQSSVFMLSVLNSVAKDEELLRALQEKEHIGADEIELARARMAFQVVAEASGQGRGELERNAVKAKVKRQLDALSQFIRGVKGPPTRSSK